MSHTHEHSEEPPEIDESPAQPDDFTDEQVFLELGLRGDDGSHNIDRLTDQVIANLSRLDEASAQVLVIESLHGLQLAIGQTAQDTRRIARLLLAHQNGLREARRIAEESRQWQRNFGNTVNRVLWLLVASVFSLLASHIWEIVVPHHETVQATVTAAAPAVLPASPSGFKSSFPTTSHQ